MASFVCVYLEDSVVDSSVLAAVELSVALSFVELSDSAVELAFVSDSDSAVELSFAASM